MAWYLSWSDSIAKRVCKYLLQRYLGQYLEEKLNLDQLTIDLYSGTGTITNVALDVVALNELAVQQNLPFVFVDGYMKKMSFAVPWSSPLKNAISINVGGLHLTVQFKERDDSRVSMFESMWSSMTSSMQLAEDCIKSDKKDGGDFDSAQTFEGIEKFARTIDSILTRIKVKFTDTTVCIEQPAADGVVKNALEVKISSMEYFDEAGNDPETSSNGEYQTPAFSIKNILLDGVSFYSDERFDNCEKTSESSQYDPLLHSISKSSLEEETNTNVESNPILLGRLAGRQEVRMKFKQDGVAGPKVELEVNLGALTVLVTPRQLHSLLDLFNSFTSNNGTNMLPKKRCTEKPMEASDFRKIEQELQKTFNPSNLDKGLVNQGWNTSSLDGSDDEFTTLQSTKLNESMLSSSASSCSSSSSVSSSKYSQYSDGYHSRKTNSGIHIIYDKDPNLIVFRFHIMLSSCALVILHDDIITVSGSKVVKSSLTEMRKVADNFFTSLGLFTISGYGNKDFDNAKEVFLNACQRNHLRLLAAPVIIEGCEKATNDMSSISSTCTASSLEFLECIVQSNAYPTKQQAEYINMLKFNKKPESKQFDSSPCMKFTYKHSYKIPKRELDKKSPHTDISFNFQPFNCEVDITIIDRIWALLNPGKTFQPNDNFQTFTANQEKQFSFDSLNLHQVIDNNTLPKAKQDIQVSASSVVLKIRFPVPDLRPIHDLSRPAWWCRSVRKEFILLDMTDFVFKTSSDQQTVASVWEVQCRKLSAKFLEDEGDTPVTFLEAHADPQSNTIIEGVKGLSWPRIVVSIYPTATHNELDDTSYDSAPTALLCHSFGHSLVSTLENTTKRESSPFSSKKVVHESDTPHSKLHQTGEKDGEELVIPGTKTEISEFVSQASQLTKMSIDISLPFASLLLPSKHLFEIIYNRIGSDLLLWEPSFPGNSTNQSSSYNQQQNFYPAFNLCKSGVHLDSNSDSDSESREGTFYSVYEQKQKHKKKELYEKCSSRGQSKLCINLTVGQGLFNMIAPARDSTGNVIPNHHGELLISFDEGNLFYVNGYKGKSTTDYLCFQANHTTLYHNGLISDSFNKPMLRNVGCNIPAYLDATIYKVDKTSMVNQNVGIGASKSLDMLTVALKVQNDESTHHLKTFRVAAGIRSAILRHRVCNGQVSWFNQLIDFFDVYDYPIEGYTPSRVLTEINVHLWDCLIDYRPLCLPIRSVISVGSFNISSNIAAKTQSSTLRFIAEDATLFLSDKCSSRTNNIDLRRDYVCVVDVGLFELSLRLSEQSLSSPKVDLRASATVVHIRTCTDSAKALTELLMYFASDGDLHGNEQNENAIHEHVFSNESEKQILVSTEEHDDVQSNVLSKSDVKRVTNLMEEAMIESKRKEEGTSSSEEPEMEKHSLGSEVVFNSDDDSNWENDFIILDDEAGMGIVPKNGLPEVRVLTDEPIRLLDNHFSIPMGKTDLLRAPKHYPTPVLRYTLREMSLVWHMYGGSDFQNKQKHVHINEGDGGRRHLGETVTFSKSEPHEVKLVPQERRSIAMPWRERGGDMRRHDILMELQLNKVRFQYEVYPDNTIQVSRQVLLVHQVEIRDRLASSHINKFLYLYSSEAMPRQSHANMVVIKSVLLRADPKLKTQECCLKVSLLPLRLNIDQDSIQFLYDFFSEISNEPKDEEEDTSQCSTPKSITPTHQVPVMSVKKEKQASQPTEPISLIVLDEKTLNDASEKLKQSKSSTTNNRPPSPPVFFKRFIFSPEVPVKLDYHGKRVDMTHGSLPGILMGLAQLNNSELKLKRICHRHGLLGVDKLLAFILNEWTNDIKKNQLPSILGGVGPIPSLVQLFQGIRDLFWLPIEQYQKDGRLVRGFQRGANSFTTSTAMAALELTSRLIQIIQSTAETAYDMVSPGPSVRMQKSGKGRRKRYSQPADIREGVANAFMVVREGIGETAQTIVRVANEEHEQKGVTGAVGGVLRQIPPTMVKPIILATEATNNVLGGMRSQLVPDARKEAVEKWRTKDL